MPINSPALRRYYRAIRRWLPCGGKQKKQIMQQIQNDIRIYLEQNPTSDMAQIKKVFGEPEAIAASYIENMNMVDLLRSMRTRRRIVTIVIVAVTAALLMWGSMVTWGIVKEIKDDGGYIRVILD